MKKGFAWILICIIEALVGSYSFASVPEIPDRPVYSVVDLAGILSDPSERQLNDYLCQLEEKTSTKMMILTVESLEGDSMETLSSKTIARWQLNQISKGRAVLSVGPILSRTLGAVITVRASSRLPRQ